MLKTHFVRNNKVGSKVLTGQLNSVVLNYIPRDQLVTKDSVVNIIMNSRDKNLFRNPKTIENAVEDIIKQGFLIEIHGLRLEKVLGF